MTVEAQTVIAGIIGVLGALGAQHLIPGLMRLATGKADREKLRVQQLIRERDEAEAERDHAESYRRRVEEMASETRRIALEAGVARADLPDWPTRTD